MTEQRTQKLLAYLPLIVVATTVVASAVSAQLQIGTNKDNVTALNTAIESRVPQFLYDASQRRTEREFAELEDTVESNAAAIQNLIRRDDADSAKLELEIERIRAQIDRVSAEQKLQLENILRLLQEQQSNQ